MSDVRCGTCRHFEAPIGDTAYSRQQFGWCLWIDTLPKRPEFLSPHVVHPSAGGCCETYETREVMRSAE